MLMLYRIVRRSVITGEVVAELTGRWTDRDAAERRVLEYERTNKCQAGGDHGFGMGSGFVVEALD
jgi:hypothetical protein